MSKLDRAHQRDQVDQGSPRRGAPAAQRCQANQPVHQGQQDPQDQENQRVQLDPLHQPVRANPQNQKVQVVQGDHPQVQGRQLGQMDQADPEGHQRGPSHPWDQQGLSRHPPQRVRSPQWHRCQWHLLPQRYPAAQERLHHQRDPQAHLDPQVQTAQGHQEAPRVQEDKE